MYQTQNDDFNLGETSPSKENVKFEYKKDILSIARRLLIYFVIFCFFSLLGRSVLRQMQLDSKYYYLLMDSSFVYTITAVFLYIGAFIGLIAWVVKTKFPFKRIFEHVAPKKMTVGTFFLMSGSIFGIRFVSKFILMGIDKLLTQMGIPVSLLGDASPEITSSIVFVLYIGLVAPFVEEVIFRGFIGYRMERYGKIFAIGFSAMIFSLFHANLSQEIFTFFLGILLAYIAFEYGFQWAVAFHMINNFIFAIIVDIYISSSIVIDEYPLHSILEFLGFILLIYILFTKLPEIKAYISENHAFKGIGFITFTKWQIVLYILVILYYSVGIYFIPRGF